MATSVNLGRVVGYSAYEIAVQNGYEGTEEQWLNSLKGADGAPGATGPAGETGPAGADGADGSDGFSPVATVARNQADDGVVISITDANGTTTATVYDGEDGSGGIPTDPDEEYTNVLSGAGIWANAWDVARQGAYARANIITFETKVLETPSPITVYLNNFPSYYLTDTIQTSWAFYREGEGSGGDGFPMELASHTQQQTGETWTYTEENGDITLVFVNDWNSVHPWTITITNPDWTNTGVDYLSGLAVEHDNFADAVNEVVDTGSSAPTYTAGTGIDITNNVISSTVVVPTATSDLTNDSGFITSSALSGYAQTANLATVATSGDYSDLSNTPTIPTALSDLTNDEGFITSADIPDELPSISSGDAGKVLAVNSGETGVEWATVSAGSSVSADGNTIIDTNGVLSTAVGGGRTQAWPRTLFFEWNSTDYPGVTFTQEASNLYIKMSGNSGHYLQNMDYYGGNASQVASFNNLFSYLGLTEYIKLNWYIEMTMTDDTVITDTLVYKSTSSTSNASGIKWERQNDTSSLGCEVPYYSNNTGATIWIINNNHPDSDTVYKELKIYIEPKYNYSFIDSNYIPIDESTIVNKDGRIKTALNIIRVKDGLYQAKDDNSGNNTGIVVGGNTINPSTVEGVIVAGRGNVLYNGYSVSVLGDNNNVGSNYWNVRLIGDNLSANADHQVILGRYNSTSTAPFVIGAGTANNARKDAMTIDANGNATFSDTVAAATFTDLRGNPIGGVTFPISEDTGSEADGEISDITIDIVDGLMLNRTVYEPDDPASDDPVYTQTELISSAFDSEGLAFTYEDGAGNTEQAQMSSNSITFESSTQEPDPEDENATVTATKIVEWNMDSIQLIDQTTGDIYTLSINNGQLSITLAQ